MSPDPLEESGIELRPDHARVVARFFVPGREDVGPGDSRAAPVIDRIMDLSEEQVTATLADIDERFQDRHRHLHALFDRHAEMVIGRLDPPLDMSTSRRLLLGASFTHEYTIEGAALCNPSAVPYPDEDHGDGVAFILSVRGVGEGHRSSIGFRTGRLTPAGQVIIDAPGRFPQTGSITPGVHHRSVFHTKLGDLGDDHQNASFVLDSLPDEFGGDALDEQLALLGADSATRRNTDGTIAHLRGIAQSSYEVRFADSTSLSERVLWPHSPAESHGMEDARFVRFMDDDTSITYYATYTAFDGSTVSQHLLNTDDFVSFTAKPLAGDAAIGKGLALFPRRIDGRYVALSRADRETNGITFSDDLHCWNDPQPIQVPERPWELLQLGNCGSPIETEAGWLVLTHGVGPMRTYALGAILLDLRQPQIVLARTEQPILTPDARRRDGYVPNVIYSCGGFAHGDTLVLPYGVGDQTISVATLSISQLIASMRTEG